MCVPNKIWECKYRLHGRKCNSDQLWNNDKYWCECKASHAPEKDYVYNPATCNCENGKNLASIMDDSAIICDETRDADAKLSPKDDEVTKTIPTNFNEKKATCKTQNFYILLVFLLITIGSLLIAISIYCSLIKYRAKQLFPFHYTNNELR